MSASNENTRLTNKSPKKSYIVYLQGASSNTCGVCCLTIGNLSLALVAFLILKDDDSDCSTPIRFWLYIYALSTTISVFLILALVYSSRVASTTGMRVSVFLLSIYLLFATFWFCLGNYWLYSDSDCKDSFESGFIMTLVVLILSYISILMMFCGCSACICCAGVFGAALGQTS